MDNPEVEIVQSLIDALKEFRGLCDATITEMKEAEELLDETTLYLNAYKHIKRDEKNG